MKPDLSRFHRVSNFRIIEIAYLLNGLDPDGDDLYNVISHDINCIKFDFVETLIFLKNSKDFVDLNGDYPCKLIYSTCLKKVYLNEDVKLNSDPFSKISRASELKFNEADLQLEDCPVTLYFHDWASKTDEEREQEYKVMLFNRVQIEVWMENYLFGVENYFSDSKEVVRLFNSKKNNISGADIFKNIDDIDSFAVLQGKRNIGLATKEISIVFDGVYWSEKRWHKNLSSSKWLHSARIHLGSAGGTASTWNPLSILKLIEGKVKDKNKRKIIFNLIKNKIINNIVLKPWRDELNEYLITYCYDS